MKFQIFLLSNIALHGVSKRKYIIFMVRFLFFIVLFGLVMLKWHQNSAFGISCQVEVSIEKLRSAHFFRP